MGPEEENQETKVIFDYQEMGKQPHVGHETNPQCKFKNKTSNVILISFKTNRQK